MDMLRHEAEHETDEIFTPEWLHAQQERIAHRLEHVARPACVIRFPARTAVPPTSARRSHGLTRWISALAAAVLLIGLGIFYDAGRLVRDRPHSAAALPVTAPSPAAQPMAVAEAADEAFLVELELAVDQPYTRALAPFDALTPQLLEAANTVR